MFMERITVTDKNYNNCYFIDSNGEMQLKDECFKCDDCKVDDIFYEAICHNKNLCEHG